MFREILILLIITCASFSHTYLSKCSNLEQKRITRNNVIIKDLCEYRDQAISSQITAEFSCGTFEIIRCQFFNNQGIRFSLTGTMLRFYVYSSSFTNCSTSGNQFDSSAIFYKNNLGNTLNVEPSYHVFIDGCAFTGCGQAIYISNYDQSNFPIAGIGISNMVEMFVPTPDQTPDQDQIAISCILNKASSGINRISSVNYTNSNGILSRFIQLNLNTSMGYINIMNVKTRRLFSLDYKFYSILCLNINQIEFSNANPNGTIFKVDSVLTLKNVFIFNLANVNNNIYLVDNGNSSNINVREVYTTLTKANSPILGTLKIINDRYALESYDCKIKLKPTHSFSASTEFSASTKFTLSIMFTSSSEFSQSSKFSSSNSFSTAFFTFSCYFSKSAQFSKSTQFTKSNKFSLSNCFTRSGSFTPSNDITSTNSFTPSNIFTPSDSMYVYFEKMSRQAKLPPQTSPYGILSTTAMATVSTSVIISIIIVGVILMIFYVRQQKKNLVEPEIPDLLQLPSDSSDTTEDCVLSFSYTFESISNEDSPFMMDPEYYLSLRD